MLYPALSRAIDGFILAKSAIGLSANTIRNYKTDLQRFTEWMGDQSIDTISSKHLERYFNYLQDEFRITKTATTKIPPRKLSAKSIRNVWGTLSSQYLIFLDLLYKKNCCLSLITTLARAQTSNNYKVEYTDISKLNRLRLEDSFLPGALQYPIRNSPEQFLTPLAYAR